MSVPEYASQTFTFSPDEGYEIEKVLADGKEVGASSSYTFENVTSNHSVSVAFVEKMPDTYPDGTVEKPDGSFVTPDGVIILPDGSIILNDGTKLDPDSSGNTPQVNKDGTVTAADGSVRSPDGSYLRPAKSTILNASAAGNRVTVTLAEQAAGAYGYDYVIGSSPGLLKTKGYYKVNKNSLSLDTSFYYLNKGTYYAACHAWFRGSDGRKVFGPWSEVEKLMVSAVTPETPRITRVTVKGSTVTVTYTKCPGAIGYDVILGKYNRKVNGELRPVNYGKLVRKVTKKNTVTATFKNVPNGTYYAGLHAYNRTSEDQKKVFSPWSDVRRVKVAVKKTKLI